MIEKLRELVNKKTLSLEDRSLIVSYCFELGIEFNPKSGCENCYFDQIFKVKKIIEQNTLEAMEEKKNEVKEAIAKCNYVLNPELEIDWINPEVGRVNKYTLTDEMGANLVKQGLGYIFSKMPKNEDN